MAVVQIDRFGRVLVPSPVRRALGAQPGSELELSIQGDSLVVRVLRPEQVLELEGLVLVADVRL